jgi:hypothetical protein
VGSLPCPPPAISPRVPLRPVKYNSARVQPKFSLLFHRVSSLLSSASTSIKHRPIAVASASKNGTTSILGRVVTDCSTTVWQPHTRQAIELSPSNLTQESTRYRRQNPSLNQVSSEAQAHFPSSNYPQLRTRTVAAVATAAATAAAENLPEITTSQQTYMQDKPAFSLVFT